MSDSYAKLFSSITSSTIWGEPAATRVVWVTMLAMKRRDGCVYASIPGLARQANVTLEECEAALQCFLSPDPYSRTKENEGRRIEEIDGGWRVLNAVKFDALRSIEERKEYMKNYMRNRRKKGDGNGGPVNNEVTNVSNVSPNSSSSSYKDKNQKQEPKKKQPRVNFVLPDWITAEVWAAFTEMRKRKRAPLTDHAATLIVKKLDALRAIGQSPDAILDQSTMNSWTDVYAIKTPSNRSGSGHGGDAVSQVISAIDERERRTHAVSGVVLTTSISSHVGSVLGENGDDVRTGVDSAIRP